MYTLFIQIMSVNFSLNGQIFATGSADKITRIYDIQKDFKLLYQLKDAKDYVFL